MSWTHGPNRGARQGGFENGVLKQAGKGCGCKCVFEIDTDSTESHGSGRNTFKEEEKQKLEQQALSVPDRGAKRQKQEAKQEVFRLPQHKSQEEEQTVCPEQEPQPSKEQRCELAHTNSNR